MKDILETATHKWKNEKGDSFPAFGENFQAEMNDIQKVTHKSSKLVLMGWVILVFIVVACVWALITVL